MKSINIKPIQQLFALFLLALTLFSLGCKKIDKLTQFNMEFDNSITIPSSTLINLPVSFTTPERRTESESTFEANDTRKDLIEEIKLTDLRLSITSPNDGDFDFLESVEVFLDADGLQEKRIAWKEDIPSNQSKNITLVATNSDLKEFIKKDKFTLRVSTVMDETLSSDFELNIHSNFFVDAKILGQ